MKFEVLTTVRDRLKADPALSDWFSDHYPGLPPYTFIGLKPDLDAGTGIPADWFPYIAVSPLIQEKPAMPDLERTERLSIMFGVNDDRLEDSVFLGIRAVCELGELILEALREQPIGEPAEAVIWTGEATSRSDAGTQHPMYEGEIILTLSLRIP